ncbi:MAG TPA: DUF4097 family beta strand repeat-containing protein [Verrucomicrobiae bacterium]|nr:DUF4097 family beta strand repeat-containing protein [Verrucomicrobiae bacterium]
MKMKIALTALAVLALSVGAAAAQVQIDKKKPASPNVHVQIRNSFGSLRIVGNEAKEVSVTGRLAPGAEGLEFEGDRQDFSIEVATPEDWSYGSGDDADYRSELEIRVPSGASLDVETLNASIAITGVDGVVNVETVNGAVSAAGNPKSVQVNSVTGKVDVVAVSAEVQIESVSGAVSVKGAARTAEVTTTSGAIDVMGKEFERVQLKSTGGDVHVEGSFRGDGGLEIETFSGSVQLLVPADIAARFKMTTFSGGIESSMGPKPVRNARRSPYMEVRFATAETDFDVSVTTYSGNIVLRKSGETKPPAPAR